MGTSAQNARLEFRLPAQKKHIIEQAQEILKSESVTVLSDRDRDAFLAALDNPPEPNAAMLRAVEQYKSAKAKGILR